MEKPFSTRHVEFGAIPSRHLCVHGTFHVCQFINRAVGNVGAETEYRDQLHAPLAVRIFLLSERHLRH
jgi:hypothetical protein